jgi:putative transposase
MTQRSPCRYFKTSPEIIRLTVRMCGCYPLPLRKAEDQLPERGIEISHETDRFWWHRCGRMFVDATKFQPLPRFKT